MKILFYGYGNPGRQDDGVGIAFVEALEKFVREQNLPDISFDTNYQLNIEDAFLIKDFDLVFFCDASREDIRDFCLTKVSPSEAHIEFTMHAVSPAFVLDLCQKIYHKTPDTRLLHIKGYEWDFREGISNQTKKNLEAALSHFKTPLSSVTQDKFLTIQSI